MHDDPKTRNRKEDQQLKSGILFFIALAIAVMALILLGVFN